MDLSLKPLRCFVAVAELRSFTRAAEQLHMTQPSLSIQVNHLEQQLGCRLFDRTTRQVVVTPSGERLREFARRMVESSDRLLNEASTIRGEFSNRLRIGAALYTATLPERFRSIEGFMDAFPQVAVTINSHTQREILLELTSHKLDIAMVLGIGLSDEEYESGKRSELTFPSCHRRLVLRRERVSLLVPADGSLATYKEIPLTALKNQKIVVPSDEHGLAITEPIQAMIREAQAEPVLPPDSTATGVERHGRKFGLPAITFGWFSNDDACSVRRPVKNFALHTEYAVLSQTGDLTPAAQKFMSFVSGLKKQMAAPRIDKVRA